MRTRVEEERISFYRFHFICASTSYRVSGDLRANIEILSPVVGALCALVEVGGERASGGRGGGGGGGGGDGDGVTRVVGTSRASTTRRISELFMLEARRQDTTSTA
ncbi:hypothetical protein RB195_020275 [Necator americanus]|uniref:Uncharacterized protein n=1 Tax=Necator americanus TaxID=51031 RepID=A0ABR1CI26_NECAM